MSAKTYTTHPIRVPSCEEMDARIATALGLEASAVRKARLSSDKSAYRAMRERYAKLRTITPDSAAVPWADASTLRLAT